MTVLQTPLFEKKEKKKKSPQILICYGGLFNTEDKKLKGKMHWNCSE